MPTLLESTAIHESLFDDNNNDDDDTNKENIPPPSYDHLQEAAQWLVGHLAEEIGYGNYAQCEAIQTAMAGVLRYKQNVDKYYNRR